MEKLTAFFLVLAQLIFSEAAEYDYSYSRYNSYSDYDCNKPLLLTAHLKATSSLRDRGPENAKLHCKSAWTAADSTMNNNLAINLDGRHEVRVIETRGRSATNEFVEEYIVQYSDDGETWRSYTTSSGEVKMFKGNSDGDHIRRNEFEVPIIAQWVRINPTRWRDRISLRVELYGCDYVADTLAFNGSSMVKWDLLREPLTALRESIRFRFKTSHASGVLLYSRGSQGDLIALQLWENRLLFNIDLGSGTPTSLWAGSLLDDNVWHDVVVSRNRRDVLLSVDRVVVRMRVRGEFSRLDLNRAMYVGGVPYKQEGLIVLQNFTGCMENLYLNSSNILWEIKEAYEQGEAFRYQKVNTMYTCPEPPVVPVTFLTRGSYARLKGYEGTSSMNVSFHFRTFEETGLLLHHDFTSGGWVRLFLEDGKVKVELIGGTGTEVKKSAEDNNGLAPQRPIMDNYDEEFNDGRWHAVMLAISTNSMILSIDRRPVKTTKQIKILTGPHYLIAGGKSGHLSPGFIGCMRLISIDGNYRLASDWKPDEFCCEGEVVMDACHMTDRCNPNPCEHGGVCRQSSLEFICHCQGTGYAGAVCHTPTRALSCTAQQLAAPSARSVQTNIDVDGSGPLAPFPVTCTFLSDGRIVTSVEHSNTGTTGVDGFQEAGSFRQDITYDADRAQLEALLDRSTFCRQRLSYSCRASRLLNSPSTEADFRPFAWWISRGGRRMDYWAGALPGSRKCQCGLNGSCRDPTKWCNCDSGTLEWDEDGGDLTEKEFLPVRQLRFGDTGTPLDEKEGRYTLGPLECEGDDLFSNVITFRVTDATILLPTFDMGHSGDIYFEFKTTVDNAVILHSKGPQDYIKISIVGGHQLQFQYQAGSGPLGVTVETSYRLADNLWHSVSVERNRKEARLVLDGALRGSVREPAGPVRALRLGGGLMIGATVDFRDGFVGCIRALLLNGLAVDLLWHARRGLYGVGEGCNGRCDSQPCMNNGTCLEGYDGYSCDCRWTAFKGPICADEIGVHLRPSSIIKYDFMGSWRSTIAEKIRVGFTTTNPKGFLLGFSSNISGEYLTIMVSNSGHLRVVFDFGFERQELIFPNKHFGMGQYHDVRLSRKNSGATLVLQIDNYEAQEYDFNIKDSADAQFNNIQYMYIGRNESMHEGFIGCISRVEFDDIYPLKLLFQEKGPANVKSLGSPLTEDFCGVEPVTHPPIPVETRPPPIVDEDQLRKDYHDTDQAILGGVLLVVFILLVIAAAVVVRALARHSGEYLTREESGAAAADTADDAALAAATGPRVTKRREWFI